MLNWLNLHGKCVYHMRNQVNQVRFVLFALLRIALLRSLGFTSLAHSCNVLHREGSVTLEYFTVKSQFNA